MVYAENYQHFIWYHAHQHNTGSLCTEGKTPKNWPSLQKHKHCGFCWGSVIILLQLLQISPHSQDILMLPMEVN